MSYADWDVADLISDIDATVGEPDIAEADFAMYEAGTNSAPTLLCRTCQP